LRGNWVGGPSGRPPDDAAPLWGAGIGLHFRRFATFPRRTAGVPPTDPGPRVRDGQRASSASSSASVPPAECGCPSSRSPLRKTTTVREVAFCRRLGGKRQPRRRGARRGRRLSSELDLDYYWDDHWAAFEALPDEFADLGVE